jgi:hypothetical protein
MNSTTTAAPTTIRAGTICPTAKKTTLPNTPTTAMLPSNLNGASIPGCFFTDPPINFSIVTAIVRLPGPPFQAATLPNRIETIAWNDLRTQSADTDEFFHRTARSGRTGLTSETVSFG